MKYFPSFLILSLALVIILLPDFAWAEEVTKLKPGNLVPCEGAECTTCHVVTLGQNILKWLIGVLTIVFALMAAWAGFGLVTSGGNQSAKSSAKSMMTNALIGFLIVLAGWLIVDTLLKSLLTGGQITYKGVSRPWSQIECLAQRPTLKGDNRIKAEAFQKVEDLIAAGCPFDPNAGGSPGYKCANGCVFRFGSGWSSCPEGEVPPTPPPKPTGGDGALTESEVRSALTAAGINISSTGSCSDPSNSTCTGLEGLRQATINDIVNLKSACNCAITLTGGTEAGHAENDGHDHSSGYKYDISRTGPVSNYITTKFDYIGIRSDGAAMYKDRATGSVYSDEGNHWDVLVGG